MGALVVARTEKCVVLFMFVGEYVRTLIVFRDFYNDNNRQFVGSLQRNNRLVNMYTLTHMDKNMRTSIQEASAHAQRHTRMHAHRLKDGYHTTGKQARVHTHTHTCKHACTSTKLCVLESTHERTHIHAPAHNQSEGSKLPLRSSDTYTFYDPLGHVRAQKLLMAIRHDRVNQSLVVLCVCVCVNACARPTSRDEPIHTTELVQRTREIIHNLTTQNDYYYYHNGCYRHSTTTTTTPGIAGAPSPPLPRLWYLGRSMTSPSISCRRHGRCQKLITGLGNFISTYGSHRKLSCFRSTSHPSNL